MQRTNFILHTLNETAVIRSGRLSAVAAGRRTRPLAEQHLFWLRGRGHLPVFRLRLGRKQHPHRIDTECGSDRNIEHGEKSQH